MFGRATITLGIGPHSSCSYFNWAIYLACCFSPEYACFCHTQIEHKSLTLGEVLDGDRMALSQYELKFKGEVLKIGAFVFLLFFLRTLAGIMA